MAEILQLPAPQRLTERVGDISIVIPDVNQIAEIKKLAIYHELSHLLPLLDYAERNEAKITGMSFGKNMGKAYGMVDINKKEEISLAMLGGPLVGDYSAGYQQDVIDILELCQTSDKVSALSKARDLATQSIKNQGGLDVIYRVAHTIHELTKNQPSQEFFLSGDELTVLFKKARSMGEIEHNTIDNTASDELINKIANEPMYFFFRTPKDGGKSEIRLAFGKNASDKRWSCSHGIGSENSSCQTCREQNLIEPLQFVKEDQLEKAA